jgi:hypothetical protein
VTRVTIVNVSAVALVGRDRELSAIAGSIAASAQRSAIVEIVVQASAGKSALIDAATRAAADAGVRVLRCRPTATAAALADAGLGDLLECADDLAGFEPQLRTALERALLLGDPTGEVELDPRSVHRRRHDRTHRRPTATTRQPHTRRRRSPQPRQHGQHRPLTWQRVPSKHVPDRRIRRASSDATIRLDDRFGVRTRWVRLQ